MLSVHTFPNVLCLLAHLKLECQTSLLTQLHNCYGKLYNIANVQLVKTSFVFFLPFFSYTCPDHIYWQNITVLLLGAFDWYWDEATDWSNTILHFVRFVIVYTCNQKQAFTILSIESVKLRGWISAGHKMGELLVKKARWQCCNWEWELKVLCCWTIVMGREEHLDPNSLLVHPWVGHLHQYSIRVVISKLVWYPVRRSRVWYTLMCFQLIVMGTIMKSYLDKCTIRDEA